MKVVAEYSHLGGLEILKQNFPSEYNEIVKVIESIKPTTKISSDKTKKGLEMFNQTDMNTQFKASFKKDGFVPVRDNYETEYLDGTNRKYKPFKETDFVKGQVGVEVQFGKYAFMLYDLIKFQYFFNKRKISVGVEIVATKGMVDFMDTGVSFAEQLISDIERLDRHFPSVPVAIIVIDDESHKSSTPIMARRKEKWDSLTPSQKKKSTQTKLSR